MTIEFHPASSADNNLEMDETGSPPFALDYVQLLADEAIAYAHKLMHDTADLAQDIRRHNLVTVTSLLEVLKERRSSSTITHARSVAYRDESDSAKAPATDSQPHSKNGKKEEEE